MKFHPRRRPAPFDPRDEAAIQRFAESVPETPAYRVPPPVRSMRSNTVWVWLIVFWPFIANAIVLGLTQIPSAGENAPFVGLVFAWLAPVALAVADRSQLRRFGFERPAHWAWILLTAFPYLIARYLRTRNEMARGAGPLFTAIALALAVGIAGAVAAPFARLLYVYESVEAIEKSIEGRARDAGVEAVAICPPDVGVFRRSGRIECVVRPAVGKEFVVIVRRGFFTWDEPILLSPEWMRN